MNRCLFCGLLVILSLCLVAHPAPAQTLAFIPEGDGNITRVDSTDEIFTRVALDSTNTTFGVAVTPSGNDLLVTRRGDVDNLTGETEGTLTLISTSGFGLGGSQINRTVGIDPRGVAVDSRGRFAYVANFGDNDLSRIDLATRAVSGAAIETGEGPMGVAAFYDETADLNHVYVTNNTANTVSVISDDGTTATLEATLDVDLDPVGIAVTPDGRFVYVANSGGDTVTIIQTSDNAVVNTLPMDSDFNIASEPWGVAVGGEGDFVYVTNSSLDTVVVISPDTQTIRNTFNVGDQPRGVAAPRNGDFAYVVNQGANSITRIDMVDLTATQVGDTDAIIDAFSLGAFIGGPPPVAPTDLTATTQSSDEIELAWTDNSDDETGFRIERRRDEDTEFTRIASVSADATSFNDGGLQDNTTYHYRVQSFNEAADSAFSAESDALTEEGGFTWCFIGVLLSEGRK